MFDIGWMELLLIGIVALIVVGPKDLPVLFRNVGRFMGKARGMAREFQRSMEQAADESGLKDAARDLDAVNRLDMRSPTKSARKYAEGLVTGAGKDPARKPPAPKPASTPTASATTASAGPAADAVQGEHAPAPVQQPAAPAPGGDRP